jgi:hypothetical protein
MFRELAKRYFKPKKNQKSPHIYTPYIAGYTYGELLRFKREKQPAYIRYTSGTHQEVLGYLRKPWGFRDLGCLGFHRISHMCNGGLGSSHMCNGGMIINKPPPYSHEGKFTLRNLHRWGYLYFMGFRGAFRASYHYHMCYVYTYVHIGAYGIPISI